MLHFLLLVLIGVPIGMVFAMIWGRERLMPTPLQVGAVQVSVLSLGMMLLYASFWDYE